MALAGVPAAGMLGFVALLLAISPDRGTAAHTIWPGRRGGSSAKTLLLIQLRKIVG
jgi:hypothetical protein